MTDRRQHPRRQIGLRVTMLMLEPVQGYVRDLSLSGIFVNTAVRVVAGDEVDLEIQIRGEDPIAIKAVVVRAVLPIGLALRFAADTPQETLARLDRVLKAQGKQSTGDV